MEERDRRAAAAGMRPDTTALVALSDLTIAASLPVLALVAWIMPPRRWPAVLRVAVAIKPLGSGTERRRVETIASTLGIDAGEAARIFAAFRAAHLEERVQSLREWSPQGWTQPIRLEGVERLEEAGSAGRGCVLWVTNAVFAALAVKKALHARGFELHHLSRPSHGLSSSRFGVRFLNPIRTRIESRYLAERVVVSAATTVTAMRRLRALLAGGKAVSITVGDWARRSEEAPFLGRRLRLATVPAQLAAAAGAPLLPVFTEREAGGFRVTIAERLPVAGPGGGVTATLEAYCRRLEPWVRANPELWNGWDAVV